MKISKQLCKQDLVHPELGLHMYSPCNGPLSTLDPIENEFAE